MKKLVAIVLATLMVVLSMSITVFAEEDPTPYGPTNHMQVIEFDLVPAKAISNPGTEIMPMMWKQEDQLVHAYGVTYTAHFNIPDPNFAFEVSATDINGNPAPYEFTCALMYELTSPVASVTYPVDGVSRKEDWIDVDTVGYHLFRLSNPNPIELKVHLTFYSWTT